MPNFAVEVVPIGQHTEVGGIDLRSISIPDTITAVRGVGEAIAETCATVFDAMSDALDAALPDELTLEFGVSLSGEGGLPFVGKVSSEGSFKVTAMWKKPER